MVSVYLLDLRIAMIILILWECRIGTVYYPSSVCAKGSIADKSLKFPTDFFHFHFLKKKQKINTLSIHLRQPEIQ